MLAHKIWEVIHEQLKLDLIMMSLSTMTQEDTGEEGITSLSELITVRQMGSIRKTRFKEQKS